MARTTGADLPLVRLQPATKLLQLLLQLLLLQLHVW